MCSENMKTALMSALPIFGILRVAGALGSEHDINHASLTRSSSPHLRNKVTVLHSPETCPPLIENHSQVFCGRDFCLECIMLMGFLLTLLDPVGTQQVCRLLLAKLTTSLNTHNGSSREWCDIIFPNSFKNCWQDYWQYTQRCFSVNILDYLKSRFHFSWQHSSLLYMKIHVLKAFWWSQKEIIQFSQGTWNMHWVDQHFLRCHCSVILWTQRYGGKWAEFFPQGARSREQLVINK